VCRERAEKPTARMGVHNGKFQLPHGQHQWPMEVEKRPKGLKEGKASGEYMGKIIKLKLIKTIYFFNIKINIINFLNYFILFYK
jgi:hypothetical protein